MYQPQWKRYEKKIRTATTATESLEATEAFDIERQKEMKSSAKAREWEKSRKEAVAREKPQWVKERITNEQAPIKEFGKSLRHWQGYDAMVRPCPNYLILEPETPPETDSGIILAPTAQEKNVGVVLAIGGDYVSPNTPHIIKPPCKEGDRILFKKGAGIEIEIKDKRYRFMQYSDVLAIFQHEGDTQG